MVAYDDDFPSDEWLITNEFTLANCQSASVVFWAGTDNDWVTGVNPTLEVTTDDGVSWTELWNVADDGNFTSDWLWVNVTVDLTAYIDQPIKLAWTYTGQAGNLYGLDNVQVLTTDVANIVTAVEISDVADNNDGSDLNVAATIPSDETTVSEYRVMVVLSENAAAFDVAAATAVADGNYTAITPSGADIDESLAADAKDVDGAAITENIAYKVFVLSIADGTTATVNSISDVSEEITLIGQTSISEIDNVVKIYSYDNVVFVDVLNNDFVDSKVSVYSISGQEVYNEKITSTNNRIILDNVSTGTYFVKISNNENIVTQKVYIK